MFNSKRENFNKIAIFTIAILLVLATIINVSLAYFTDSASTKGDSSGEIRFGTIAIKVSVAGENYVLENGKVKFTLTADEVVQSEVYRTIILENADGKTTEDFAMRLTAGSNSSKVEAELSPKETDYIDSADLISSNWQTGTDSKSYFTKFVHLPEGKKAYIPVVIKMNNLSPSDFSSSLFVTFDIEIIQAANDGYKSWETKPASLNITETYTPLNEYTQLEYIESTGTQYIDTGYYVNPKTRVKIDFAFTSLSKQQRIFGHSSDSDSGSNLSFCCYINGSGKIATANKDGIGNWLTTGVTATTDRVTISMDEINKKLTILGNNVNYSSSLNTITRTSNLPLTLFVDNRTDVYDALYASAKLYSFKIWDNKVLVRNFIPSQNSSGAVGLYDTVTKTFYGNAGTGTFVAGSAV